MARRSESIPEPPGDYALFHRVRSCWGSRPATLASRPIRPKALWTLEFLSFSGPAQAVWAVDKFECDHDRGGNSRSPAQVPGKPWRSEGARPWIHCEVVADRSGANGRNQGKLQIGNPHRRPWRPRWSAPWILQGNQGRPYGSSLLAEW